MNGSTITYGIRSFPNITTEGKTEMVPIKFGCSDDSPSTCGADTSYRLLQAWNASRFFPYAGVDLYKEQAADMSYYSAYLAQDRLYMCRPGGKSQAHPEFKRNLQDIVMNWHYIREDRLDRDYNSIQTSFATANYTNPGDENVIV